MTDRDLLAKLVAAGNRFRRTPIVDDDFPAIRDEFDRTLRGIGDNLKGRPRIVTLCGSTRFFRTFQEQSLRLTLEGKIVLSIGAARCADDDDKTFGGYVPESGWDEVKKQLDELHCKKIDMSDEILVLNVNGYIGDSTRREIEHAKRIGVPVTYLNPEN